MLAAIKRWTLNQRVSLDDLEVLSVLKKMLKQRKESIRQYEVSGRLELAAAIRTEITVVEIYLLSRLDEAELDRLIATTISDIGALSLHDTGKVIAVLKGCGYWMR